MISRRTRPIRRTGDGGSAICRSGNSGASASATLGAAGRAGSSIGGSRARLGPAVAQPDRAVEDEPARRRVGVSAEIALALELDRRRLLGAGEPRLDDRARQYFERVRVEVIHEVAAGAGIGAGEQRVV